MNTIYENEIIENKMTELLNTRLDTRALMTVDTSLSENAGLRKVINRYTYTGKVENLAKGEKNSEKGSVSFIPEYYDVKRYQQTFEYNDMDAMADPYIVDVAMQGAVTEISNEINEEYFAEILKIGNTFAFDGESITYADIVDALSTIDCEVDSELFIIMGSNIRAQIRKDPDFMSAKQGEILYSGQFGTICGIPVLFSKLMPKNKVVITTRSAVRFFVKKGASVEQARDIETKDNTVVYERHGLIALVDDTKSIIIGRSAPTIEGWSVEEQPEAGMHHVIPSGESVTSGHLFGYKINAEPVFYGDVIVFGENGWKNLEDQLFWMENFSNAGVATMVELDSETLEVIAVLKYTFIGE